MQRELRDIRPGQTFRLRGKEYERRFDLDKYAKGREGRLKVSLLGCKETLAVWPKTRVTILSTLPSDPLYSIIK